MKKRKIIIWCCVLAVVMISIGVFSALFNLRELNVEILSNASVIESYGEDYETKIIESGDFPYGSNTLFSSYVDSKTKIEKAYPYVKVEKMVRKFPNKMTIYVSGRKPELIIKDNSSLEKWYVVDYDMKVLEVLYSNDEANNDTYRSIPKVIGGDAKEYLSGDFLKASTFTSVLVQTLDGIYGESRSPSSVMTDITIDLSSEKMVITLDDRGVKGATISISGFQHIQDKVFTAFHHYKETYETDDVLFPNKSDIDIIVGKNFVPGLNETITVHDRRDD